MNQPARPAAPDDLAPWTLRADNLADDAVAGLKRFRPRLLADDVLARARGGDAACVAFVDEMWRVPMWVDPVMLERGALVSRTFGLQQVMALMLGTLVEGYAAPNLAAPLVATGRLKQDALKRGYETGQMIHNVRQRGGLLPGAPGHRTIVEVRLLHAMVRQHLDRVGYRPPDGGAQVHLLDMAHTGSGIAHVGTRALGRLGVALTPYDREAVHHMWRLANHYHGVPDALLPIDATAGAGFNDRLRQQRYDIGNPYAPQLVHALLDAVADQPPFRLPRAALHALTRRLIDAPYCDAWGIEGTQTWRRRVDAMLAANRATTRAFYRAERSVGPVLRRASHRVYVDTLRAGLGARGERAFRDIADNTRAHGVTD